MTSTEPLANVQQANQICMTRRPRAGRGCVPGSGSAGCPRGLLDRFSHALHATGSRTAWRTAPCTVAAVWSAGASHTAAFMISTSMSPCVARRLHRRGDHREVDAPVAEVTAAEQRVGWQRQHPVADLVADDPPPGPGDLVRRQPVPPHVVRIDHHPHRVGGEQQSQVDRLVQARITHRSTAQHRVQRLDAEPDPYARARDERTDRVGDHAAGEARSRCPAQPAGAEHERAYPARRPRDRRPVVGDRGQRPPGSATVKNPPRHRLETWSPAARTAPAASARPASATRSRHSPTAGISCRAHSATASAAEVT